MKLPAATAAAAASAPEARASAFRKFNSKLVAVVVVAVAAVNGVVGVSEIMRSGTCKIKPFMVEVPGDLLLLSLLSSDEKIEKKNRPIFGNVAKTVAKISKIKLKIQYILGIWPKL
jgi:hypothetical protein